jgi:hypothetical protein
VKDGCTENKEDSDRDVLERKPFWEVRMPYIYFGRAKV